MFLLLSIQALESKFCNLLNILLKHLMYWGKELQSVGPLLRQAGKTIHTVISSNLKITFAEKWKWRSSKRQLHKRHFLNAIKVIPQKTCRTIFLNFTKYSLPSTVSNLEHPIKRIGPILAKEMWWVNVHHLCLTMTVILSVYATFCASWMQRL